MNTEGPMHGTWTLTSPDGRTFSASSPLACAAAEQAQRIPPTVALQRVLAAADEVVLSRHIAQRAVGALEQGIDLPDVAKWVAADIRRAMTAND